ncbi:MAG: cytochrome c biogenesis protein CcsA [Planctomycetes bacterium]|nr:cytochrome c biogenesis protein CcsA [Planctomycetota bacterium]
MKRLIVLCLVLVATLTTSVQAQEEASSFAWTEETLELASTLPVQHGGRVKPLSTYAGFQLLRMNGKRTVKTITGERIGPTAWILDCLFRPDAARTYECFRIQNDEVVTAMGVRGEEKRKSDYYSYDDLEDGLNALFGLADAALEVPGDQRSLVQTQALLLASNIRDFRRLIGVMDFGRESLPLLGSPGLTTIFAENHRSGVLVLLEKAPELRELWTGLEGLPANEQQAEQNAATELSTMIDAVLEPTQYTMTLFPPPADAAEDSEWLGIGDAVMLAFADQEAGLECIPAIAALEDLVGLRGNPVGFEQRFAELHEEIVSRAAARGEYDYVPLEVRFYRGDFFYRALLCYLVSFLLCCLSWMLPASKWVTRGIWATLLGGTGLVILGIVLRCIIRERPPVSTLYETILFITAVGVIVAIAIEAMNRQRIAVVVATVLGAGGMFLSMKYELKEAATAGDTMPSLVAVLDTNFWLATHVTTVTMGYAAGLLASLLAHVWLFGQMFGIKLEAKSSYKALTRMIYGVVCFGLLFSVVGTILGGIWANYSWGRFWGWDPKENGALLICLWQLLILHGRMGGYTRDFGLCVLSVVLGVVVVFSWWGVNLLGVGLHSYGFTDGVASILKTTYGVEALVVLMAGAWKLWSPRARLSA